MAQTVQIIIDNVTSKIVGFLPDDVQDELYESISYKDPQARHMWKVKSKQWDGVYRLYYRHKSQSFYSGLVSLVTDILDKREIGYSIKDIRVKPEENLPLLTFSPPSFYETRDYQQFTIDRSLQKTRGIIKMATGGGKTMTVVQLISRIRTAPFMFYVLSVDLMEQAYDVLSSTLNEPIGRIGGNLCDIRNINVCTIQTAIRSVNMDNSNFKVSEYLFDEEDAGGWDEDQILGVDKLQSIQRLIALTKGIYFDEMHHASCRTAKDVLTASPYAFWKFGGSATPYREDNAEIVLQGLFGRKIVDISASYLIEHGFLIRPYILFDPIDDNCHLRAYQSIYKECVVDNANFNTRVANIANHLVKNGLSVLILVKQYKQGDYIKKLIPNTEFLTGKMKKDFRKAEIQKIRDGSKRCIIGTSLFDEGIDCPCLDAVVMAGGGASSTRVYQRIGRTLRPFSEKNRALVVCFEHNAKYLEKHIKRTKTIIKKEPLFVMQASAGGDFIFGEMNEIMSLGENKTIFDV